MNNQNAARQSAPLIQYNAPFVLTFAIISGVALFLHVQSNGALTTMLFSIYRTEGFDVMTGVRLLFHVFGHTDWQSFSAAIIPILVIGPNLEERYGVLPLALGTVATALVSGIIHIAAFPDAAPMMGAAGVLYMMLMMASVGGGKAGGIPITMLLVLAFYAITELQGLGDGMHVDRIVGGLCGLLIGMSLRAGVAGSAGVTASASFTGEVKRNN